MTTGGSLCKYGQDQVSLKIYNFVIVVEELICGLS